MSEWAKDLTGVALAIIGVATLTVLVRSSSDTAKIISQSAGGFSKVLGTAMGG